MAVYGWEDFEPDVSTDAIPDKYILTITLDGEEVAVIVHRATEAHPYDGGLMQEKRRRAQEIVETLNRGVKA
jgi:hypothetical protein